MKFLSCVMLALVALTIFTADVVTKYLTDQHLPPMDNSLLSYPYGGIPVFKNFFGVEFSISHMINTGAAWGLFRHEQVLLLVFRISLVAGILIYMGFFNKNRALILPLTLLVTGAIGNILDYFVYGHVVDMIHFIFWGYDFPVFNVADSSIFVGIFSMCIIYLFFDKEDKQELPIKK